MRFVDMKEALLRAVPLVRRISWRSKRGLSDRRTFTAADVPLDSVDGGHAPTRQSFAPKRSSHGPDFIGDIAGLQQPGAFMPDRAVITGELVFASLQNSSPGPAFTALVPRVVTPWFKVRNPRLMHLWVHNDLVVKRRDARVAFAVDGVLRYGKRTKGRAIVFNGYRGSNCTYLHWYRFTNGELVDIQERVLRVDDTRYQTEINALLSNIAVDGDTKLYWTDPLPAPRSEKLIHIGSTPFQRVSRVPLARREPARHRYGPWLVASLALMAYLVPTAIEWAKYSHARARYEELASAGPRNAESLEVLRARQDWLASPAPMQARIAPLAGLFSTIASHPTWQIQRLQINAPTKGRASASTAAYSAANGQPPPDLQVTISVPREDVRNPLDQAQGPLRELANATGLLLRVAASPVGLVEQTSGSGKVLLITIEASADLRGQHLNQ